MTVNDLRPGDLITLNAGEPTRWIVTDVIVIDEQRVRDGVVLVSSEVQRETL